MTVGVVTVTVTVTGMEIVREIGLAGMVIARVRVQAGTATIGHVLDIGMVIVVIITIAKAIVVTMTAGGIHLQRSVLVRSSAGLLHHSQRRSRFIVRVTTMFSGATTDINLTGRRTIRSSPIMAHVSSAIRLTDSRI